jgi:hypothetical protein
MGFGIMKTKYKNNNRKKQEETTLIFGAMKRGSDWISFR